MRILLILSCLLFFFPGYSQPKKEYYDQQQIHLKSETDYYKGMPHGKYREFYKSGKVSREGSYYYGQVDSVWTIYYDNGQKKAIEGYFRGKKSGTNRYYFKS